MSNDMPRQPTTVHIEAPPAWAIALSEKVATGFASVDSRLDSIETSVDVQGAMVNGLAQRLTAQEARVDKIVERQDGTSIRAKGASEVDLQHEATIGRLVVDVANLTTTQGTQLDILRRLDAVAANPMVRRVAYAVGAALLAYLTARGMR